MTNAGFILPEPGYHDSLSRLTRETGTLLAIDETHSLVTAHGGLTRECGLGPKVSIAHTAADIDLYVVFGRCLSDLVASDAPSA